MEKNICDFTVEVSLQASGLLGGTHEYAPYLGVHGTFGKHKKVDKLDMVVHSRGVRSLQNIPEAGATYEYDREMLTYRTLKPKNFQLPNNGPHTRVDNNIWFKLWCHSRDSGVPELDKRESVYVERDIQCGIVPLSLSEIMSTYKELGCPKNAFKKEYPVIDQRLVKFRVREWASKVNGQVTREMYESNIRRITEETMKGMLTIYITMNEFHERNYRESVYAMPNFQSNTFSATLPQTSSLKSRKQQRDGGGGARGLGKNYQESTTGLNGGSSAGKDFTPISYTSEMGVQKMLSSLEKYILEPYVKHFIKMAETNEEPLCQPLNKNVSNLQLPMWDSEMGQTAVANYWSCNDPTTREYPNEALRRQDLEEYGLNAKSEKFLLRILGASMRRFGMSAEKFEHEIRNHFSTENKSTKISEHFLLCEEIIARLPLPLGYYTADYRFIRTGLASDRAKIIVLDSWDRTLVNDIGKSDDCEGEDETATSIIRTFGIGRHTVKDFQWESPLLNAVKLYLGHTLIYDIGATVTSAYLDTDNSRIETKMKDLPMIGDAMDQRSQCDGHCHALMGSLTDAIVRLGNGNIAPEILTKIKAATIQDKAFQQRDGQRTMLVLEATGSMETRILPVEEAYQESRNLTMKKKAERNFIKSLKLRLDERKKDTNKSDFSDLFQPDGIQHYVEKQDPQRRISSFYNEVVHATSLELWKRFDISLSQMAFARKTGPSQYQYGAKIADFIRNPKDYAFVFPFHEMGEEWKNEVVPFMESVQHQQAIMSFGRYSDQKYEAMEKASGPKQTEFERLAESVALDPNLSIIRLQSRPWKMEKNEEITRDMKEFLSSSPGLVEIGYFTEHHMPVCDPIVEILCIIKVDACLEMANHFPTL